MADRIQSFEDFWPFYLGEHRDPLNRVLHFIGTTAGVSIALFAVVTFNPLAIPAALVAGYGPAWIGHFFVEKNRPASFKYPLYSLRGDCRMWCRFVTGRLTGELKSLGLI